MTQAPTPKPDAEERLLIERACERLSIAYANHADAGRYDDFGELFAEDGFLNAGAPLTPKAKIVHVMGKRSKRLRSRHVMTNILIDVIDATHARGVSYLTLFRHVGDESLAHSPINSTLPAAIGHYEDEFVLTPSGWRFQSRILHLAFQNPEAFAEG